MFRNDRKPRNPVKKLDICNYLMKMGVCGNLFDASKMIEANRVKINEETLKSKNKIVERDDEVFVDGKKISFVKARIYSIFKSRGVSIKKDSGSDVQSIYSIIPSRLSDLIVVGDADNSMEGLVLLTNHPRYAKILNSPYSGIRKVYKAKLSKILTDQEKEKLHQGFFVSSESKFFPSETIKVRCDYDGENSSFVTIYCTSVSVKNIRAAFFKIGVNITGITRVAFGDFKLSKYLKDCGSLIEEKFVPSLGKYEAIMKKNNTSSNERQKENHRFDRKQPTNDTNKEHQNIETINQDAQNNNPEQGEQNEES